MQGVIASFFQRSKGSFVDQRQAKFSATTKLISYSKFGFSRPEDGKKVRMPTKLIPQVPMVIKFDVMSIVKGVQFGSDTLLVKGH